ncbi:MAG: hypothetical protein Tsb0021_00750 [Chlamydiales bacterium]
MTDGFSLWGISSNLPYNPNWEVEQIFSNNLFKRAFSQRYFYLGKGCQSYVFESEDGIFVIKFFKFKHLKDPFFLKLWPFSSLFCKTLTHKLFKKEIKRDQLFLGCKHAFERLKEETGLLFLHLNKTNFIHKKIEVIDKLGFSHHLELDETIFILQKKAKPCSDVIREAINVDSFDVLRQITREIYRLILIRNLKGMEDKDPAFIQNIGFNDTKAMILDVGHLHARDRAINIEELKNDIRLRMGEFRGYLKMYFPKALQAFDEEFYSCLQDLEDSSFILTSSFP